MSKIRKTVIVVATALSVFSASAYACRGSICGYGDGWVVTCDVDTGEFCSIIIY